MTSVWDFVLDFRPVSHPCVFSISGLASRLVPWVLPMGACTASNAAGEMRLASPRYFVSGAYPYIGSRPAEPIMLTHLHTMQSSTHNKAMHCYANEDEYNRLRPNSKCYRVHTLITKS